ncbi:ribosome small subunit-dependent GTPase A [Tabrizicola sp.]|uniref:ribosome small subunit-dependent GTPase A n=1 Tax=Tabrizicola sp. TaxID=2005166 RepID=UPI00286A4D58|nr:ribosome small subunit-dependent GTPase A [Tabrizicola sp.]
MHHAQIDGLCATDAVTLPMAGSLTTGDLAVGDWVLSDGLRILRCLDRKTELGRRAKGSGKTSQLIAANVDTLFIVTSCNADFNPARLERYLALSADAGTEGVILLTKADSCPDPDSYRARAERLRRKLCVLTLDARDPGIATDLGDWCRHGQTVALVGSSGVGKTTLTNSLTGLAGPTQPIREGDARGRHTTTSRSLHALSGGGWLIDTPGMRSLSLMDATEGIDAVFEDVTELIGQCRFHDCSHQSEPGCAVPQAIEDGHLDAACLRRWEKLKREDRINTETVAEARERSRWFGRQVKKSLALKSRFDRKP